CVYVLCAYATLFRSQLRACRRYGHNLSAVGETGIPGVAVKCADIRRNTDGEGRSLGSYRSEEHTSELQSRFDLVCRLLLEKKKRYIIQRAPVHGTARFS